MHAGAAVDVGWVLPGEHSDPHAGRVYDCGRLPTEVLPMRRDRVRAAEHLRRPLRPRGPRDRRQLRARSALRRWSSPRPAPRSPPRPGGSTSSRSSPTRSGERRRVRADRRSTSPTRSRSRSASPTPTRPSASSTSSSTTPASPTRSAAHKMSLELTDAVLDTNLRGPWLLANEVARGLLAAKQPGRIVNISSMGAFNYGGNGAALVLDHQGGDPPHDRGAGRRVVALRHQRQLHRPRGLLVRDDGRDAVADGRHHAALPAPADGRSGADGLDAAVPRLPRVGGRHGHAPSRSTTVRARARGGTRARRGRTTPTRGPDRPRRRSASARRAGRGWWRRRRR